MKPYIILCICLIFFAGCSHDSEPTFQGKKFSEWMILAEDRDHETQSRALEALLQFGDYRSDEVAKIMRRHPSLGSDAFLGKNGTAEEKKHFANMIFEAMAKERRREIQPLRDELQSDHFPLTLADRILAAEPPVLELIPDLEKIISSGKNESRKLLDVEVDTFRQCLAELKKKNKN